MERNTKSTETLNSRKKHLKEAHMGMLQAKTAMVTYSATMVMRMRTSNRMWLRRLL
jgi:hypothetical protein